MIKLYLIGGFIVATIIGIISFWIAAKRSGKKEERCENMEESVNDALEIKKDNIKHRSVTTDTKRKWLRKYTRD